MGLEQGTEAEQSLAAAGFDGAQGNAELGSDLRLAEALEVGDFEHFAFGGGQLVEGGAQVLALLDCRVAWSRGLAAKNWRLR
jgi:hypothetical protein